MIKVVSAFVIFCLGERWYVEDRFYIILELKFGMLVGHQVDICRVKKIREIDLALI